MKKFYIFTVVTLGMFVTGCASNGRYALGPDNPPSRSKSFWAWLVPTFLLEAALIGFIAFMSWDWENDKMGPWRKKLHIILGVILFLVITIIAKYIYHLSWVDYRQRGGK